MTWNIKFPQTLQWTTETEFTDFANGSNLLNFLQGVLDIYICLAISHMTIVKKKERILKSSKKEALIHMNKN